MKNAIVLLLGLALNLQIGVGSMDILTISIFQSTSTFFNPQMAFVLGFPHFSMDLNLLIHY